MENTRPGKRSCREIRNHQSTVNISRLKFYRVYSRLPVTQTAPSTINRQQFGLPSPSMPGNRHRRGTTNRPMSVQKHPAQRCVLCSRLPVTRATVANLGVLPPLEVCGVTCDRSSVWMENRRPGRRSCIETKSGWKMEG